MSYVALLRAINVGGHIVSMEKLRGLFSELGLTNVRSYIQTGNLFFDSEETDPETLRGKIEDHLREVLGYAVPTCLRTIPEFEQALRLAPFATVLPGDNVRLFVAFLSAPLRGLELPLRPEKADWEMLSATDTEAYIVAHQLEGRPSNPGAYLEKHFGISVTLRFFATSEKILAAALS